MGYQNFTEQESQILRNTILSDMYHIIGKSISRGWYAFKGGYILSKKLNGIRRTSDLDVTILNHDTFELATHPLCSYLDGLVQKGIIWDYTVKMPVVTEERNMSGGFKVYVKPNANARKYVFCGIDMSIHPLGEGVELSPEGYCQYSKELMLADKVSALYNVEKSVFRRIRDLADIYLILQISDKSLNKQLILDRIYSRGHNIKNFTTFEKIYYSRPSELVSKLNVLLSDGSKLSETFVKSTNLSSKAILEKVSMFLSVLRG